MLRDQADVIDANARRKKDHRHALQNSGRPVSSMLYYSVFIMRRSRSEDAAFVLIDEQ